MGNLYTHIVRRHDPRIEILSFLKQAYRTTPRDYEYIHKLKDQLKKIDSKNKRPLLNKRKQLQKKYGAFAWKVNQQNLTKP
jgi:hypothetical protein